MDPDHINTLLGIVLQVVVIVATIGIAWLTKTAKTKWGIDIEATHREALHSAVMTAARDIVARIGPADVVDPAKLVGPLRDEWMAHVRRSVPDAIVALSPAPDVLDRLVVGALQKLLAERAAR